MLKKTLFLVFMTASLAGCMSEGVVDSKLVENRDAFLLNVKPVSATTLGVAQAKVEEEPDVVIEGWADLKFFEGKHNEAIFLIREILDTKEHGGEGHDPSTCPFCKRRMEAAPKATVVFTDDSSNVLPYSVDKLFNVKHGDKVVVKGKGVHDKEVDMFQITANKIHVTAK